MPGVSAGANLPIDHSEYKKVKVIIVSIILLFMFKMIFLVISPKIFAKTAPLAMQFNMHEQ
ncbi:hypothetical protein QNI18_06795 [Caminicella sporogenes]|nr:hypothetical protein [Caminicella sporogenes]WIF94024.1 hypothetical protein QNI18_06795 [Caminicella sporogenes]